MRRLQHSTLIFVTAIMAITLLIANVACLSFEELQSEWTDLPVILALYVALIVINSKLLPGRWFCWPNIYITLLELFHLGYYIPAKLGLVPEDPRLPGLTSPYMPLALTLFGTALLALEVGVLLAAAVSTKGKWLVWHTTTVDTRANQVIFRLGGVITVAAALLFGLYIYQLGGVARLLTQTYADYYNFLTNNDPRLSFMSVSYLPVGLLLLYVALHGSNLTDKRRYSRLVLLAMFLLAMWLMWLGNRGMALLSVLALAYVHHIWVAPIPIRKILSFLAISLVAIAIVKEIRLAPVGDRISMVSSDSINPVNSVVEFGGTIKVYVGFVELFASGSIPRFGTLPYEMALGRLLPNVGSQPNAATTPFYRSNVWITEMLEPWTAQAGGGLGSSGIAEPYASFDYPGVIAVFAALGLVITILEVKAAYFKSTYSVALLCFVFIPLTWYIRDDVYGQLRLVIWGWAAVSLAFLLLRTSQRAKQNAHPAYG